VSRTALDTLDERLEDVTHLDRPKVEVEQHHEHHHPSQPTMKKVDARPSLAEQPLNGAVLGREDKGRRDGGEGEESEPIRVGAKLRLGEERGEEEGWNEEGEKEGAEGEGEKIARRVARGGSARSEERDMVKGKAGGEGWSGQGE